jgi:hypothetical protein
MKATITSKIGTLDNYQGLIFMATPDGTTLNVNCFAYRSCSNYLSNLNIGVKSGPVGVWRDYQFEIEWFRDPQNWKPY